MEERQRSGQTPPERLGGSRFAAAGRRLVRAFAWHLTAFVAANAALTAANLWTGGPWWAFWPLLATGFVLALHYLFYKAAVVDERWVDARVEELNLKSYDRSHIEDLKARHGGKGSPGADAKAKQAP
jgi:hypothetical protein